MTWIYTGTGNLANRGRMDFRVGTVLLFFTMMMPGEHGIMETAATINLTGYARWIQIRYETLECEITQSECQINSLLLDKLASMLYVTIF